MAWNVWPGQSLSRYMDTEMGSTSFWMTLKGKASEWLRYNASALVTMAGVLSPLLLVLVQRLIEGLLGTLLGILVCILVQIGTCILRHYFAWIRERYDVPIPDKRFTEEKEDGEVTIEYARLQELILFMDEYENWLEENGIRREEDGSQ